MSSTPRQLYPKRLGELPKGKKWSHWRDTKGFLWSQDLVDALDPKFLQLISASAVKVPTEDRYDRCASPLLPGSSWSRLNERSGGRCSRPYRDVGW